MTIWRRIDAHVFRRVDVHRMVGPQPLQRRGFRDEDVGEGEWRAAVEDEALQRGPCQQRAAYVFRQPGDVDAAVVAPVGVDFDSAGDDGGCRPTRFDVTDLHDLVFAVAGLVASGVR